VTFASGSQLLTIGAGAFLACINLTSFVIPASVTTIGDQAFSICTSLTSINIPSSVTSINQSAFNNCTSLTSISVNPNNLNYLSDSGVLYSRNNTTLIRYPIGKSGSTFIIPALVTSIDMFAFFGCAMLTSVTFASSSNLQTINFAAFRDCINLTSFVIPASVTTISVSAFQNATSLATVTFLGNVPDLFGDAFTNISSSANAYYRTNTNNRNLAQYFKGLVTYTTSNSNATIIEFTPKTYAGALIIPSTFGGFTVTSIGTQAFQNATNLTSITIPVSVTSIGENAFQGSGLSKMYVSTINGLGLKPGTSVTLYGKSFTVIDIAAPPAAPPAIPICFLAGTTVTTDQGDIAIEKLSPYFHTIRGKKIVSIVTVHPVQKLMYKGKMVSAIDLVEGYQEPTTPPSHLYLVRLKGSRQGRR